MQNKKEILKAIGIILIFLLGMIAGFVLGVNTAITKGMFVVSVLMDDGIINITADNEVLESLIRRYVNSARLT